MSRAREIADRDLAATELILDADNDTSITADTDDQIDIKIGGTDEVTLSSSGIVINEGSNDRDFRVESNGNTHMLFVDGGNDGVGIGTSSVDTASTLTVSNTSDAHGITIVGAVNKSRMHFQGANTGSSSTDGLVIGLSSSDDTNDDSALIGLKENGAMTFQTNNSKRLKIGNTGVFQFGSFSGTEKINFDMPSQIFSFLGDATAATLRDSSSLQMVAIDGNNGVVAQVQGGASGKFGRGTNDGTVVEIRQAGTLEGSIGVSGSTVSISAFTGSHWSRLTDNSKPTILRGTVMESIDEMCDWYNLKFTIPEVKYVDGDEIPEDKKVGDVKEEKNNMVVPYEKPLNVNEGDTVKYTHEGIEYDAKVVKEDDVKHVKAKISNTADCTSVYGVFSNWDNDDDTVNDMYIHAVGTSVVRIHKDQTVAKGDLLTSNGDGTAKKQDDDIIRSKTIGKVLANIKQETYSDGSYTVPCALYCG